jgi:hypothetical protein
VSSHKFDTQFARNQGFNSAGNVASALLIGLIGYRFGYRAVFFDGSLFCHPQSYLTLANRPHKNRLCTGTRLDDGPSSSFAGGHLAALERSRFVVFSGQRVLVPSFKRGHAAATWRIAFSGGRAHSRAVHVGVHHRHAASDRACGSLGWQKGTSTGPASLAFAGIRGIACSWIAVHAHKSSGAAGGDTSPGWRPTAFLWWSRF